MDKNPGKYEITIIYGGNDNYTGSNATKIIKIEEKVVEPEPTTSSSSDTSSSERSGHYSPQFRRVVYDDEVLPIPD